jgi:type III restriction enzyme
MPATLKLKGALRSLYRSDQASWDRYEVELAALGEPPPVMIVVCPNTVVSKLVFDWIAGREFHRGDPRRSTCRHPRPGCAAGTRP